MEPHTCILCQRYFYNFDALKRHLVRHKTRYGFHHSFSTVSRITTGFNRKHESMKICDESRWYECGYCQLPIQDRHRLMKHMRAHTSGGTPVKTHQVGVSVESSDVCKGEGGTNIQKRTDTKGKKKERTKDKKKKRKANKLFTCPKCHFECKSKRVLRFHCTSHVAIANQCDICRRVLKSKAGLLNHRRMSHSAREQGTVGDNIEEQSQYGCAICKFVTRWKAALIAHEETHLGDEICPHCKDVFTSNRSLRNHLKIHSVTADTSDVELVNEDVVIICQTVGDNIEEPSQYGQVLYGCAMCKFVTKLKPAWIAHEKTHRDEETCPQCKEVFASKRSLAIHLRIHRNPCVVEPLDESEVIVCQNMEDNIEEQSQSDQVLYECAMCRFVTKLKPAWIAHEKTHREKATFPQCKEVFASKKSLQNHLRIHSDTCDVEPIDESKVIVCQNVEDNIEEPSQCDQVLYECDMCKFVTKLKPAWIAHEKTHREKETCSQCKEVFASLKGLRNHLRIHRRPKSFKCAFCKEQFSDSTVLTKHVVQHTLPKNSKAVNSKFSDTCDVEPIDGREVICQTVEDNIKEPSQFDQVLYECAMCKFVTKLKPAWIAHEKTHLEKVTCPQCTAIFASKKSLQNHLKFHCDTCDVEPLESKDIVCQNVEDNIEEPSQCDQVLYECDMCKFVTKLKPALIAHEKTHREKKTCSQCKEVFASLKGLQNHLRIHSNPCVVEPLDESEVIVCQNVEDNIEEPSQCDQVSYECDMCKFVTKLKPAWIAHEKTHREKVACPQCKEIFASKKSLYNHLRIHHTLAKTSKAVKSEFRCQICGFHFEHPSGLSRHAKSDHPGLKPFECQTCDKKYLFRSELVRHNRTHTGERPFICSYCKKAFTHKKYLTVHERSHTANTPYSCQYCSKTFRLKDTLTYHERTHTGVKPYSCQDCGKSYITNSGLKYHERSAHVKEKPFQCTLCPSGFSQRSDLAVHIRIHSGVKPFKCGQCTKAFATKQHLHRHEKTHKYRKKTNECAECGRTYLEERHLRQHIAAQHPVLVD